MSAFSIAFFAMLRVSEIAVKNNSGESAHVLNYERVKVSKINGENQLHVTICSSKYDHRQNYAILVLQKQSVSDICPIQLLQSCLLRRFRDQMCLTIICVRILKVCRNISFVPSFKKTIKQCGRWISCSFLRYICT